MKKATSKTSSDMRAEYDFTGGVRGKYYKAMQQGYTITIHKALRTLISLIPSKRKTISKKVRSPKAG